MFREWRRREMQRRLLSPRELQIRSLRRATRQPAAAALSLSAETVRFHIRHLCQMDVHSKSEAVIQAFRRGIIR